MRSEVVETGRTGPPAHGPFAGALLVLAFVVVAIAKPWGPEPTPPGGAGPSIRPSASATPRHSAGTGRTDGAFDEILAHCLDPQGWRVFAWERWSNRTVRSWKSLVPIVHARGPGDSRIPVTVVAAAEVLALGYCAPTRGRELPPEDVQVTVWRIEGRVATEVQVERVEPERENPFGGLFVPSGPRDRDRWSDGHFVFSVWSETYQRWWAVDLNESGVDDEP
jgi:hypothetical protein